MEPLPIQNEFFLHPGEFYFTNEEINIGTILGSCIAICLWHPQLHIGGMCHFVLPDRKVPLNTNQPGRYAGGAIQLFTTYIDASGTKPGDYEVKIFGGANSNIELINKDGDSIGKRNAQAAMQLLIELGVNIKVADVGETGYRRISFDLSNGDVWVKRHSSMLHINKNSKFQKGIII